MRLALALLGGLVLLAGNALAQSSWPIVDGDADGVADDIDACPYSSPGTVVDNTGCPLSGDADADGDGVSDDHDDCPYTTHGARVDARGCALDSDFDGVADGLDQCPKTAYGEGVDERGCVAGEAPKLPAPVARRVVPLPPRGALPGFVGNGPLPSKPAPKTPLQATVESTSPSRPAEATAIDRPLIPAPTVVIPLSSTTRGSGTAPSVVLPPRPNRP